MAVPCMPARQWPRTCIILVSSSLRLAMEVPLALSCLACVSCLRCSISASSCGKTSPAVRCYDQVRRGDSFYAQHPYQTATDVAASIGRVLRGSDHCPHTIARHLFRWATNEWRTRNSAVQHTDSIALGKFWPYPGER